MAMALLDTLGESRDTPATKADLDALRQAVRERATYADLRALEARIDRMETRASTLEYTFAIGVMLFMAGVLQVAAIGFLFAYFLPG